MLGKLNRQINVQMNDGCWCYWNMLVIQVVKCFTLVYAFLNNMTARCLFKCSFKIWLGKSNSIAKGQTCFVLINDKSGSMFCNNFNNRMHRSAWDYSHLGSNALCIPAQTKAVTSAPLHLSKYHLFSRRTPLCLVRTGLTPTNHKKDARGI